MLFFIEGVFLFLQYLDCFNVTIIYNHVVFLLVKKDIPDTTYSSQLNVFYSFDIVIDSVVLFNDPYIIIGKLCNLLRNLVILLHFLSILIRMF